jgi:hypothetical protein
MKNYAVTWNMELDADSPIEAARAALNIMQDRTSTANCFTVCDDEGEVTHVDLEEESQKGV